MANLTAISLTRTVIWTIVGNYQGSPIASQNFMNFGLLTAKNRTVVFTHPPKPSSAWQWWPSRWTALRCANKSSYYYYTKVLENVNFVSLNVT